VELAETPHWVFFPAPHVFSRLMEVGLLGIKEIPPIIMLAYSSPIPYPGQAEARKRRFDESPTSLT